MAGFGKASFGGSGAKSSDGAPKESRTFWKSIYLKAGDKGAPQGPKVIFRIMPPLKSLENDSYGWRKKIGEHWGHVVPSKNPGVNRQLVFACVEQRDFNTNTLTVACPKCEQVNAAKESYEEMKLDLTKQGKTKEEIYDILGPQTEWLKSNRLSRQWNLNVMLVDGTFGVLKLSGPTYKKALLPLIDGLVKKEGMNPVDADGGVWFEAYRQGHRLESSDIITVVREVVDIPGHGKFDKIKKAPLSEAQQQEALSILPDLATDTVTYLAPDQIQMLVNGSNDPDENLKILGLGKKAAQNTEANVVPRVSALAPKATVAPLGKTSALAPKKQSNDDDDAFLRSILED